MARKGRVQERRDAARHEPGLGEAIKDFAVNYGLTFLAGVAGALVVAVFSPIQDVLFSLYTPLDFFLKSYFFAWGGVFIATILYWLIVFIFVKRPFLQIAFPYIIALGLFVLAGVMRSETLIPNIVGLQFVLFVASLIVLGEALIIHAIMLMMAFMREAGLIGR